ncbi:MAG: hypothetical protein WC369_02175 [Dehalococcoidales bacterium]|jgi:hypothetical protein
MTRKWHAPDILMVNGDCIEGRQERQGGAEIVTNDRNVQSEMAEYCIRQWAAKKVLMTYGTKYHVGDQAEDFEYNIAKEIGAKIEGRLFFEVEGMTIDARHKVGSSSIPHGRATSLLRDMMWNLVKSAEEEEPRAQIIVRSHVHYNIWIEQPGRIMFTTPALQLSRGRYGSRECTGETHWGAIRLKIEKGEIIGRDLNIWNLHANRPRIIRIK